MVKPRSSTKFACFVVVLFVFTLGLVPAAALAAEGRSLEHKYTLRFIFFLAAFYALEGLLTLFTLFF
ncbi:hypothetical protein IIA95_01615 [Patescibacteria group bacterium]|nr:hypothetical protein [Patescibacteria group bacterium]